jgi:DNA polymerase-3 subunit delta'
VSPLDNLLAHPKTGKAASDFLRRPAGALLILGAHGSGKLAVANRLAASVLGLSTEEQLNNHPYFYKIAKPADKQEIPIESIRTMNKHLSLKPLGEKSIRRVVLIHDAQLLSLEAQNALLKTLEEPDSSTLFLLTAPNPHSLLPTIVSRAQRLPVHPVTASQAKEFFSHMYTNEQIDSAWSLSRGSAALMSALLNEGSEHPLKAEIAEAKIFFGQARYQRLLFMERKSKDKEELKLFFEACERILAVLHRKAIESGQNSLAIRLSSDRQTLHGCRQALENNSNPRLLCLHLALNLNS